MELSEHQPITSIEIDHVFIGSFTNARLSDLTKAADIIKGKKVNDRVRAIVVPGSFIVKKQAEKAGIDAILKEAGLEWRESGCSMGLVMMDDIVPIVGRCLSTEVRIFECREGT